MPRLSYTRQCGLLMMLGGLVYLYFGVLNSVIISDGGASAVGTSGGLIMLGPFSLLLVGVAGLHARQRDTYGWLGRVGTALTAAFFLSSAVQIVLSVFRVSVPTLRALTVIVSAVTLLTGPLLLGYATKRADELPHADKVGYGLMLSVGAPIALSIVALVGGVALTGLLEVAIVDGPFGLAWLAAGFTLWTESQDHPFVAGDEPEFQAPE